MAKKTGKGVLPNHNFRLPRELVKEFEEVAQMKGYTRQEAMMLIMQQFIDSN